MNLLVKTYKYSPFMPAYIRSFNSNFKRKLFGSSPKKRKGGRKKRFFFKQLPNMPCRS